MKLLQLFQFVNGCWLMDDNPENKEKLSSKYFFNELIFVVYALTNID